MASAVIEQRILAGVRFVDVATGAPIALPLIVRNVPSERRVIAYPNRQNLHVVTWAEGFDDYVAAFESAPNSPIVGAVVIQMEVRDPSGTYLPREFTLALPRTADPAAADSVFEPVSVSLYRSPRASRSRNWAMVRVRLEHGPAHDPVPSALLRVVHDPTGAREVLGYGMSVVHDPEARAMERRARGTSRWIHFAERHIGEASVPVVGLNSQIWAIDPGEEVVLSDIAAALEIVPMSVAESGRLPNPDDFVGAPVAAGNSRAITLSVGGEIHEQPFSVTL